MKVTIDRARWRCGGTGPNRNPPNAQDYTFLRDCDGYMCCLGFRSLASGLAIKQIFGASEPCMIRLRDDESIDNLKVQSIVVKDSSRASGLRNAGYCDAAIAINDDFNTTNAEREVQLIALAAEWDEEWEFVGEYPPHAQ